MAARSVAASVRRLRIRHCTSPDIGLPAASREDIKEHPVFVDLARAMLNRDFLLVFTLEHADSASVMRVCATIIAHRVTH